MKEIIADFYRLQICVALRISPSDFYKEVKAIDSSLKRLELGEQCSTDFSPEMHVAMYCRMKMNNLPW